MSVNDGESRPASIMTCRQYCMKTQQVPLVINMPGLMKGAGLPALVEILRYANPATVLHLSSDTAKSDVDLAKELQSSTALNRNHF